MPTPNILVLLFNGLTLTLAMGLLILVLWQDPNNEASRWFSLFLFMVMLWSSGSLLGRAAAYVNAEQGMIQTGLRLLDIGFSGATISLYIYSAVITGIRGRWFRSMAFASLVVIFAYQLLLLFTDTPRPFEISENGVLSYSFDPPSILLYLAFQLSTMLLVWQNRRKIRARTLVAGILLFSALFVVATGFVGWCPACALMGRKLKNKS